MRSSVHVRVSAVALVLASLAAGAVVIACADDANPIASPADAGADRDGSGVHVPDDGGAPDPTPDAGAEADAPLPSANEAEPNNGATETETNAMTVPGQMNGAIHPANDIDLFSVDVAPGELWQWTLTPKTGDFAPHLAVFDIAPGQMNPNRVIAGTAGAAATLDCFVLRAGQFVAGVRDARNVPTPSGKGGPSYGYTLKAVKKTASPVAVTFPSTKTGKLASNGALDFYSFTGTKGTTFSVVLKAERKAQPSTLDSRMSLFNVTTKKAIITNDNAASTTDSQFGGQLPDDGNYLVIVEQEGTNESDLSYEILFQTTSL